MNTIIKNIFISSTLLICVPALAQQAEAISLSLEQCKEMAVENNKNTLIAKEQLKKAGYDKKSVHALYFPKISGYGAYINTNSTFGTTITGGYLPTFVPDANGGLVPNIITNNGVPVLDQNGNPVFASYAYMPDISFDIDPSNTYTVGLKLEQPIYMGGKIVAANRMATIAKEMSELNIKYTDNQVMLDTEEAYWKFVEVKEMLNSAKAYLDVVTELEKRVKNANELGMMRKNDLLKVQVRVNEAELMVNKAGNGVTLANMALCHQIGLPLISKIETNDQMSIESSNLLHLDESDYESRPEYQIVNKEDELRKREIGLIRADYLPQVGAAVNYGYTNGLEMNDKKLVDKERYSAMVTVSVPVFNWGEGYNKVKAKKAEQNIAMIKQQRTSELLQLDVAGNRADLDNAILRCKMAEKSPLQAELNMIESNDLFEVGMETISDNLEAKALWHKAKSEEIQAWGDYNVSKAKYFRSIGKL